MDMVHLVSVYILGSHIVYKPFFFFKFQVLSLLTKCIFKTYVRTLSVHRYFCNEIIYYGSTYALELELKKTGL